MCTLTAFGLQPMHYLFALWKVFPTNLSLFTLSLSLCPQVWWWERWTSRCLGLRWRSCLDWRTTGASVWPGAQPAPPRATAPTFASHVSAKAVSLCVCVRRSEREEEGKSESRRANVSNFLLVVCVSLSVYANEFSAALHHCTPW